MGNLCLCVWLLCTYVLGSFHDIINDITWYWEATYCSLIVLLLGLCSLGNLVLLLLGHGALLFQLSSFSFCTTNLVFEQLCTLLLANKCCREGKENRKLNTECPSSPNCKEMQAVLFKSFRNLHTLLCLQGFLFKCLEALLHLDPLSLCILAGLLLPLQLSPAKANTPASLEDKEGTN